MSELSRKDWERMRLLAKTDLFFLARGVLGYNEVAIQPHGPLCQHLQRRYLRELVLMPRGFFKTTVATKSVAIQESLRNPSISILIAAQIITNAQKMLGEIEEQWDKNQVLRALFPELIPNTTSGTWNSETGCLNRPPDGPIQQENTYEAAGIGTQLQSRHYDYIIADDLVVARKDQTTGAFMEPSEEDIQKAIGWHQMVAGLMRDVSKTRYSQRMTRWSPFDLYHFIKTNDTNGRWHFFEIAAYDADGNPTFPAKFPAEALEEIRSEGGMGPYKFATQFLNLPASPDECLFRDKYTVYARSETLPEFKRIVAACDPAISKRASAHPSAIGVVGCTDRGDRWVLDYVEDRLIPSEIVDHIIRLWKRWKFKELVLETVAYQEALKYAIQERFDREGGYLFTIREVKPGRGDKKENRIAGLQPAFESGWWNIRSDMTRLRTCLDNYPFGTYDDGVDMLAMASSALPRTKRRAATEPAPLQTLNNAFITYDQIMSGMPSKGHGNHSLHTGRSPHHAGRF